MTTQNESGAPARTPLEQIALSKATRPNSTTATGRLLELMERCTWVCGQEMVEAGIGYRYGGRLHELRKKGWRFDRRKCQHPWHHHLHDEMYQWTIAGVPGELFR